MRNGWETTYVEKVPSVYRVLLRIKTVFLFPHSPTETQSTRDRYRYGEFSGSS